MSTDEIWLIRAGRKAAFVDDFVTNGLVAVGWSEMGRFPLEVSRDELERRYCEAYPDHSKPQRWVGVGQLWRFMREVQIGDTIATYDPDQRIYLIGRVESGPEWREHALGIFRVGCPCVANARDPGNNSACSPGRSKGDAPRRRSRVVAVADPFRAYHLLPTDQPWNEQPLWSWGRIVATSRGARVSQGRCGGDACGSDRASLRRNPKSRESDGRRPAPVGPVRRVQAARRRR